MGRTPPLRVLTAIIAGLTLIAGTDLLGRRLARPHPKKPPRQRGLFLFPARLSHSGESLFKKPQKRHHSAVYGAIRQFGRDRAPIPLVSSVVDCCCHATQLLRVI